MAASSKSTPPGLNKISRVWVPNRASETALNQSDQHNTHSVKVTQLTLQEIA
jgi:hypothetical protein